ncbi:MAG: chemotaxis protein CheW, partial [Rhodoferax sp.]
GLYGVADLATLVSGVALTQSAAALAECSVVTLNGAMEVNCALLVDRLLGLRGSEAFVSSAPAASGAPSYFGNRFVDATGENWQEINLRTLSLSPQFLNIRA